MDDSVQPSYLKPTRSAALRRPSKELLRVGRRASAFIADAPEKGSCPRRASFKPAAEEGFDSQVERGSRYTTERATKNMSSVNQECVRNVTLFKDCNAEFLQVLAEHITTQVFQTGHMVFKQGEIGDSMYILKRGEVEVLIEGVPTPVAQLSDGSVFGEIAALSTNKEACKRTASIRTLTLCDCRVISRMSLNQTLNLFPREKMIMQREAERRLDILNLARGRERKWYDMPVAQEGGGDGDEELLGRPRRMSFTQAAVIAVQHVRRHSVADSSLGRQGGPLSPRQMSTIQRWSASASAKRSSMSATADAFHMTTVTENQRIGDDARSSSASSFGIHSDDGKEDHKAKKEDQEGKKAEKKRENNADNENDEHFSENQMIVRGSGERGNQAEDCGSVLFPGVAPRLPPSVPPASEEQHLEASTSSSSGPRMNTSSRPPRSNTSRRPSSGLSNVSSLARPTDRATHTLTPETRMPVPAFGLPATSVEMGPELDQPSGLGFQRPPGGNPATKDHSSRPWSVSKPCSAGFASQGSEMNRAGAAGAVELPQISLGAPFQPSLSALMAACVPPGSSSPRAPTSPGRSAGSHRRARHVPSMAYDGPSQLPSMRRTGAHITTLQRWARSAIDGGAQMRVA